MRFSEKRKAITALISGGIWFRLSTASSCRAEQQNIRSAYRRYEAIPGNHSRIASARVRREFADTDQRSLLCIQVRALELFHAHTKEMEEKYEK